MATETQMTFVVNKEGQLGYVDRVGNTHVVDGMIVVNVMGFDFTCPVGSIVVGEQHTTVSQPPISEPEEDETPEVPKDEIDLACVSLALGFVVSGCMLIGFGVANLITEILNKI